MNRSTTRLALLAGLVLFASPAAAQRTTPTITEADLRHRLGILADDSMLGRQSAELGNVRATDYLAAELQRLGLERAGENGTWFQSIPLLTRTIDASASLTVGSNTLAVNRDFLPLRPVGGAALGGTFSGRDVPVIFGGHIGTPAMLAPDSARGKFVILIGSPTGGFAGSQGRLNMYRDAAGIGIVALETLQPNILAFLRQDRVLLVDSSIPQPPLIPAVVLSAAAAEQLLGAPAAGLTAGTMGQRVSGNFGFVDGASPYPSRNVIGIIRGTDRTRRNSFIAVGVHSDHVGMTPAPLDHDSVRSYNQVIRPLGANDLPRQPTPAEAERIRSIRDSLGRVRPPRADSVFNGADDDASGVSVALELAEYFRRNPPRRSLLFVFHTAEERGLFGAQYYTEHATVPRDSILAMINLDQVSRGGPEDVPGSTANTLYLLGTRRLSTELGDIVEAVNTRGHNLTFNYDYDANGHPANGYCRSDHWMYARWGIPVAFFSAGWHRDYHMVTDEMQYVNIGTMLKVANFVRDVTRTVADLDHAPVVDKPKPADPRGPCRQ